MRNGAYGADKFGFKNLAEVRWNLTEPALYEYAVSAGEASLVAGGALCAETGHHTGRSPKDKHTVVDDLTRDSVWWDGNRKMSKENFDNLLADFIKHAEGKKLFAQDLYGGADPKYRIKTRIYTELAWHSLFIRQLLIRPERADLAGFVPDLTILDFPSFAPDAKRHGGREGSDTMVAIDFTRKIVLICGSSYAGEMKKSVFTTLNFYLPAQNVVPMHCSANVSHQDESALFFGLSGTGKTTLSADPSRDLIGDDEHGWSKEGVFNCEGGCYAKVINLSPDTEPDIYRTTQMFGTILENVVLDEDKRIKFADQSITENTRASYPLTYIPNHVPSGRGGHPKNVVLLTADAFGVLPPISKLTPEQAMYYFLSGYTAKVAGTERGVTEPQATFSAAFGAVFLVWPAAKYADMLGELLREHGSNVWLLNTGWSGGPYGVGKRMKLSYTRAMVNALLSGALDKVPTTTDPIFGLNVPESVPDVPKEILNARGTWTDKDAYGKQARKLAGMFRDNFAQFKGASEAIKAAGPKG